ncbi:minichromosome maintenance domain-containing protein 2-like isoform X1 [Scylla paramamosain]|uniref:minichromosome maintenance domain-containing protein 2-like isoform X1 n=1 Tax=Scylla paramamosain TaxID=85552 RepID=UPI003082B445
MEETEEAQLTHAALRWLDQNGALTRLQATLHARAALTPMPKIIAAPVHVDLARLHEISESLATLVVERPLRAQKIFHHILHIASVAITLQMRASKEDTDDHCPPPAMPPPHPAHPASLYHDYERKTRFDGEVTIDKEDLDLTLHSLASNLPLDASMASEDPHSVLTAAQIYTPLQVGGMPWVPEWVVGSVRDLPLHLQEPRLSLVGGRVLAVSLPSSFTKWVRYLCSNPGCVGTARDLHVRVFVLGRPESDTVHHRPPCRICLSPLSEDPASRELGERMTVMLLPSAQSHALTRDTPTRAQALRVVLRDEMMKGVEPGQVLEATVMVSPQRLPQFPSLEAMYVHPPPPLLPPATLPPVLRQLVSDRQSSPWSLVLTLAYMFAASVTPAGTFHSLKLALLLSLASCSSKKAGLAVLAVGTNTTLLLRLLWWCARYAPHSMIHSSLDPVTASCSREPDGALWVQGGSLLLARGGVCVLGEFSKFRNDVRRKVCRVLESGVVQVDCSVRHHHHTGPSLTYPLRAAAWACYDPASAKASTAMETEDNFLHVPLGDLTKSITDVFGLVVYTETPGGECEKEAEEVITFHTLLGAMSPSPSEDLLLPKDQMIQYLRMVRNMAVEFSPTAERLIRGYYVATRRLRGDCMQQGSLVPITAIHTLTQVASSHARLALRTTVEGWDAAAAVLLCEEALAAHSGYSLLQVTPTPHLSPNADLHTLVGRKNDERMTRFQKTLEEFVSTHTGDIPGAL